MGLYTRLVSGLLFPAHERLIFAMDVADADAVQHLQRPLGVAQAARAHRDRVVVVQQHHRDAVQPRVQRRGHAHRARADDDQRAARRGRAGQLGRALGRVRRVVVGLPQRRLRPGGARRQVSSGMQWSKITQLP